MELTADFRRQATKAAGVTALAPAVLLGSAVLLAAGAGFGGLGALGQVAGGPSVPSFEQVAPSSGGAGPRPSPQVPVAALAPTTPAAASGPAQARSRDTGSGGSGGGQLQANAPVGAPQAPSVPSPGTRTPTRTPAPSAPSTPQTGSAPGNTPSQTAPVTPQPSLPQPVLPTPQNPVPQLLDIPRDLGNSLQAPGGPLNRVLDTVTNGLPR